MRSFVLWSVSLLFLFSSPSFASKETLYLQAHQQLGKKQYPQATETFQKLLALLEKEQRQQKTGSQGWHQLTLAQCDILHKLGTLAWKQGQKPLSCKRRALLKKKFGSLPSSWKNWSIHPDLKKRLLAFPTEFAEQCSKVPATLIFQITPAKSTVYIQTKEKKWKALSGKKLTTLQTKLSIKISSEGYLPKIINNYEVPRWSSATVKVSLQPKPQKRFVIVVERDPVKIPKKDKKPKAAPFYKTWWFWTATGVVVGAATAVVLVTRERKHVLQGESSGDAYRIW